MQENSIKNQSNFLVGREAQTDSTVHLGGGKKMSSERENTG